MDTNYEIGDLRKKIAGELEEIFNDNKNRPVDVLTIREKYIYRAIRGLLFKKLISGSFLHCSFDISFFLSNFTLSPAA